MPNPYMAHERDQLLAQLDPGQSHGDFSRAIVGCFDVLDDVMNRRVGIAANPDLNAIERKAAIAKLVDDDILPRLATLTAPVRLAKARVDAERGKYHDGYLPATLQALHDNVGCAEAALYFARREVQPSTALSPYRFTAILTGAE